MNKKWILAIAGNQGNALAAFLQSQSRLCVVQIALPIWGKIKELKALFVFWLYAEKRIEKNLLS